MKRATISDLKKRLRSCARPAKAKILQGFFKTGPGEYGEGDQFIGVTIPDLRKIVSQTAGLDFRGTKTLLQSRIHEERLLGALILVRNFEQADHAARELIHRFYLKYLKHINNWDLVDLSAPNIVGKYLEDKPRTVLYQFAKSNHLWSRRIAIVSTLHFIRQNDFNDTLRISKILLNDSHDLIHKAVGWMLREVGKRDEKTLKRFLNIHVSRMPRTALRYSIERFPEALRQKYLSK